MELNWMKETNFETNEFYLFCGLFAIFNKEANNPLFFCNLLKFCFFLKIKVNKWAEE